MDPLARDLISNCLCTDLSKRYGNTHQGSVVIFRHDWFQEVNWKMLVKKEIPAPYVPALSGDGDSSQWVWFDAVI
jgi:protein kinase A